jgi:thiol-disulfide isomerase/thioredoxin
MEPTPRKDRTWLWVALAFASLWSLYLLFFAPRHIRPEQVREGRLADYNWDMQDLNGEPFSLSKYRGKTVFLNVWASWCKPCLAELPSISRLAENEKLKDVVFLCVSIDESPDPVLQFVKKQVRPITATIVWSSGEIPEVFAAEAIPATFLIAPDGRIAKHEIGSRGWNDPEVVQLLESLSEKVPASL